MDTLYVDEQGASIHLTGERLVVVKEGHELRQIRLRDLERVILFGPVDFTTQALHALLESGVDTHFLTTDGRYRGRLAPADGKNVLLRQTQYRRADDAAFRGEMARRILGAKLANCRYIILRHHHNNPSPLLSRVADELAQAAKRLDEQPDVEACMGVEGTAARAYFQALGSMVRREFAFAARTRRPPRDPVNAMLSFGYALLLTEIIGALAAHGLDPHVGYVHSIQYGRPALALDLLEEFRPVIADRLAIQLINRGVLQHAHFEQREGGVLLNEEGRARYLAAYHRIMTNEVLSRHGSGVVSFRKIIRQQAARMRDAVRGSAPYDPYTPR